ncbi:hypothetical protein LG324_12855 [Phycicoccus jejuensis]|uniref:hypothetical protein n=1 Tax=Phycicoccus jejuensis TaxID=367299 RepID=UPI00384FF712
MRRAVGFGLLASAFAPMVALLALVSYEELGRASWVIVAMCGVAVVLLLLALRSVAGIQARTIDCESVRRADERVLAFTASYVVPLVVAVFGQSDTPTLVATLALVALMATIYVRAGLYHLNPTLAMAGYRLYEVTARNGTVTMVLTRQRHLSQKGQLVCRYVGEDVAIQMGVERGS